jgi:ATP-dependent Clp protease adaptor protein ClpS
VAAPPGADGASYDVGCRGFYLTPSLLESKRAMGETDKQADGEVLERTRQETKKPELYKVLLLNDDYTTMDFVVDVLETIFHKQPAEAFRIMMMVHTQGKGLCGVYPFEVAETKVEAVVERAREHGFPLRAAMEPE